MSVSAWAWGLAYISRISGQNSQYIWEIFKNDYRLLKRCNISDDEIHILLTATTASNAPKSISDTVKSVFLFSVTLLQISDMLFTPRLIISLTPLYVIGCVQLFNNVNLFLAFLVKLIQHISLRHYAIGVPEVPQCRFFCFLSRYFFLPHCGIS